MILHFQTPGLIVRVTNRAGEFTVETTEKIPDLPVSAESSPPGLPTHYVYRLPLDVEWRIGGRDAA